MRDPYEVLGVPRSATQEQVKAAYRELAKKYHPDRFIDSPLAENANKKMQEINEAYDAIISGNRSDSSYSGPGYSSQYSYSTYQQVRDLMQRNKLQEAEEALERMDRSFRDAQWYYLKGQINYKRGWTDQAYTYFSMAYKMDPSNAEYRHAYENMNQQRSGGFRTAQGRGGHRSGDNCDGCDICQGLICADCCCECMGGDLIPCC
ncbi:MAG: DnaJ domain-containing protein [Clostridia bacterium]|nr:DnaJ domain-containing protein [Clostridia bacterium]